MDRNCLSFWFSWIQAAGLPVPATVVIETAVPLWQLLDGQIPTGYTTFLHQLEHGIYEVGGTPCFLRTGQTSGKHDWKHTCYVPSVADLPGHVVALVERSALADIVGLPTNVWVVRRLLPVKPLAILPVYGDMPLVREFRYFVRDAKVQCSHPYWPRCAIEQGFLPDKRQFHDLFSNEPIRHLLPPNFEDICRQCSEWGLYSECKIINDLAELAGKAVGGGYWSVDIMDTLDGWHVIDMAEGERSWHEPGCSLRKKGT